MTAETTDQKRRRIEDRLRKIRELMKLANKRLVTLRRERDELLPLLDEVGGFSPVDLGAIRRARKARRS